MGDVINCTRFLCRADDLVPLPAAPAEIPRIPLISLAYRVGTLLDIHGEKISEQDVINALQQTICQWREQGILVDLCDFTSYPRLDVSPAKYVIFLELTNDHGYKIGAEQFEILKNTVNAEVEQQLCKASQKYQHSRSLTRLGPLNAILVRSGTFSAFMSKFLQTDRVSPVQVKPHRKLRNEDHIRFFYDSQIDTSLS
ncbi:unnamed protein product [Rotaria sordida]|nr:unnamed protein product [Rotaria sordida]CAF3784077.1 unnamed protein product [Rotaria sordida]CAF4021510.1 unnamed protein product [Rotaria sordida]